MDEKPSSPQVTDSALRLPGDPPDLPADVLERFPSLGTWMDETRRFWNANSNAINDFARAVLDVTEVAGVLVVDPNTASLYIKSGRGAGAYANPDTSFYVDRNGYFSLKNRLTWDPTTNVLTVTGTIVATAGTIGGWTINATSISKNNMTLSSTGVITAGTGNDVAVMSAADPTYRFWAGHASAASAPFSVTKAGAITATSGAIGGWDISTTTLSKNNAVLDSAGQLILGAANDVVYLSSTDATYRLWVGNVTAGSATFSVTKGGSLSATNAAISGTVIVGHTTQYTDSTTSNFQVINTSGQANLIQNFCFGGGTPNFEGWVAGGTIAAPTQALSGRLMKLKLVTYGSGGGGWINGGNASVWLVTTEDHTNTARGTEIRFRTTANGTISEGYGLVIGNDGRLYIGPDNGLARDTNLYRSAADTLKTDDAFQCNSLVVANAASAGTFSGNGASLTALDAANITSGTLANGRLPSAISVTSLAASGEIRGATARFGTFSAIADTPVIGWVDLTDAAGNARRVAIV